MNMDAKARLEPVEVIAGYREPYLVGEIRGDEIYLGDLLRNLFEEWKLIALVVAIGTVGSIAISQILPPAYLVEARLRAPTLHELGEINEQNLIDLKPADVLKIVADRVLAPEIQQTALVESGLGEILSEKKELPEGELPRLIAEDFSVDLLVPNYYEISKNEKKPIEQVGVSLKSIYPEPSAEFIQELVERAQAKALADLSNDIRVLRQSRIKETEDKLKSLTLAAELSREAEIIRLQETQRELIQKLRQEIDLKLRKAKLDRENRIVQLAEALKVAESLNIDDPVSWDDLRPLRIPTQINNEVVSKPNDEPTYFRGTRLLKAELEQLKNRKDDRPFVPGISEIENRIIQAENDPRLAALKSRVNDAIYIEQYDDLQRQLSSLKQQPTDFRQAVLAVVSQPAIVPPGPIRSPVIYVVVGVVISVFVALVVALVRISLRNSHSRQVDSGG